MLAILSNHLNSLLILDPLGNVYSTSKGSGIFLHFWLDDHPTYWFIFVWVKIWALYGATEYVSDIKHRRKETIGIANMSDLYYILLWYDIALPFNIHSPCLTSGVSPVISGTATPSSLPWNNAQRRPGGGFPRGSHRGPNLGQNDRKTMGKWGKWWK